MDLGSEVSVFSDSSIVLTSLCVRSTCCNGGLCLYSMFSVNFCSNKDQLEVYIARTMHSVALVKLQAHVDHHASDRALDDATCRQRI